MEEFQSYTFDMSVIAKANFRAGLGHCFAFVVLQNRRICISNGPSHEHVADEFNLSSQDYLSQGYVQQKDMTVNTKGVNYSYQISDEDWAIESRKAERAIKDFLKEMLKSDSGLFKPLQTSTCTS